MERETRIIPEQQAERLSVEKKVILSPERMEEAATLFCSAYNGMPPWYELYTRQKSRAVLNGYQQQKGFSLFCARLEDRPVGMAIVTDSNTEGCRFLQEIFVDPFYRRSPHRVGSALLTAVLEDTRISNYQEMQLQTDYRNIAAVGLYKKAGFSESQKPEERQITRRVFTKRFDIALGKSPDSSNELPQPPNEPGFYFFLNLDELKRLILWQWLKPDAPEDLDIFKPLLDEVAKKALKENMIKKVYYNDETGKWSVKQTNKKGILLDSAVMDKLSAIATFLLSLQKLVGTKINGNELSTLVNRCFFAQNGNRLNFICFVCASYEPNFSRVSPNAATNRLRFFEDDMRKIETEMQKFGGNIKLTLFFADTDYEIYPIKDSPENLTNYKRQYWELREFCRQFSSRWVRILPWSRYRNMYKGLYDQTFARALEIAKQNVSCIPNLNQEERACRAKQMADYATQAAILPISSVLLIMEPPNFNSDYDLLFKKWVIPAIPKLQSFDVNSYKNWIGQTRET